MPRSGRHHPALIEGDADADLRRARRADGSHRRRAAARRRAQRRRGRHLRPDLDPLCGRFLRHPRRGRGGRAARALLDAGEPDDDAPGQRRESLPARPGDVATALDGDRHAKSAAKRGRARRQRRAAPFSQLARPGRRDAGRASSIRPDQPFNIIYSSGTTGTPKGIVQPHRMRWGQLTRVSYSDAVTIVSTPLYSNTTLVVFLPTLAHGGTAVLMPKFDAGAFLRLSEQHRATHAMLVPVQYRRIMERADFDQLRSFELRAQVLHQRAVRRRAEGGRARALAGRPGRILRHDRRRRHRRCSPRTSFRDKLHTVGQPMPGHDIRLIDETGREVAQGKVGEVVGRSTR